jgi:hypothetical protein
VETPELVDPLVRQEDLVLLDSKESRVPPAQLELLEVLVQLDLRAM